MAHKLKVVIFGRGTGESILVELEQNEWMVVDCFRNPHSKKPAAITYLENKGLDPQTCIKKIVITHFHQDHIAGMLELIQNSSPTADVYISRALTVSEANEYYSTLDSLHSEPENSGVSELCRILEYLYDNDRKVTRLDQNKVIHNGQDYLISAISPSDVDSDKSQATFISLLSECDRGTTPQASKINPNHFCVVLSIQCKQTDSFALLGADLEVTKDNQGGWDAAMNSIMAPKANSIQLFKIPHHGSETGFHQKTWDSHVKKDQVVSVLTTFDRQSLPRDDYIKIYGGYSKHLLATTNPKSKATALSRNSLNILKNKAPNVKILASAPKNKFGYVETLSSGDSVSFEKFDDAVEL